MFRYPSGVYIYEIIAKKSGYSEIKTIKKWPRGEVGAALIDAEVL